MAVSAHGLDRVRPAANRRLAEEILERAGCMVSEYPVGAKPVRRAFACCDGPSASQSAPRADPDVKSNPDLDDAKVWAIQITLGASTKKPRAIVVSRLPRVLRMATGYRYL